MQSIENKLFHQIKSHGKGWVFSSTDFIEKYATNNIDKALSLLVKENKIRRLIRGLYDYPKYSRLLNQVLSPDINQVAATIARKFKWRIAPSGNTALYLLGVSTQVPARFIYLSDGPNRKYKIYNSEIEFAKSPLKEIGFKYPESTILVHAIKALGKENINHEIITKLTKKINPRLHGKILQDTKTVSDWIYTAIKQICNMDNINE